ncbi:MAG: DUF3147 family protein [Sphingomicrobium sp.]|nr:DUF3147 family protein [Sphingomonadales bacterium]
MLYFTLKAALSGLLAALVAEIARRYPGWGGLVASLPLTALMAMVWTFRDTRDAAKLAALSQSTFWFVIPSLPLFVILPVLIRGGVSVWAALAIACAVTVALYAAFFAIAPRLGITL